MIQSFEVERVKSLGCWVRVNAACGLALYGERCVLFLDKKHPAPPPPPTAEGRGGGGGAG